MKFRICFAYILLFSSTAFATDYYVSDCGSGADSDCVVGNDSNTGTTQSSPWRTFERARSSFSGMQAGDRILLARGGSFTATGTRWRNFNCRAENPCVVRDYTPSWASGDEGKPIISNMSGTIFSFDGNASVSDEGYTLTNLELRGNRTGSGVVIYNSTSDLTIDNVDIDGFWIGVHIAGNGGERFVLKNSTIRNCPRHGFLGGFSYSVVESSYFVNNGFDENNESPSHNHHIYWASDTVGSRISGNELYKSVNYNIDGHFACRGAPMIAHGTHTDLVIEDNLVREDLGAAASGCWGIAIDGGYEKSEQFERLIIRRNTVINVGNLGIGCQGCTNAIIENNVIIQEQSAGGTAISVPNRLNRSTDGYVPDAATSNVTVRNNSIYTSTAGRGIQLGTEEGSGFVLANNAVFYTGTANNWKCFNTGRPDSSYTKIDNNLCYFPNAGPNAEWDTGSGVSPNPLQAFRNATVFGDNSINQNPLFLVPNAPNYNLNIGANSPLVNAGDSTLSPTNDIRKLLRQGVPDIGAYEYGAMGADSVAPGRPGNLQLR